MSTELEFKKIFMFRCLHAVILTVILQFFLLGNFLLFINISLLHPITWILDAIYVLFSLYSWLCILPLIGVTVVYGLMLGKSYLAAKIYYPTRFVMIHKTGLRKITFFFLCTLIGFLTSWVYSRFLRDDYSQILNLVKQNDDRKEYCINIRFMFLALVGIYTGIRFFVKKRLTMEPEIEFPIIHERLYIRIRSSFYNTLYTCLMESFVPIICFIIIFWLFGVKITEKFGSIFDVEVNDDLNSLFRILKSVRLIIYSWMLSLQIMYNMYLTDTFFNILITQSIEFDIEKISSTSVIPADSSSNVTLVEALSLYKLPVALHLASLDLYNIAVMNSTCRREKIFSISMPGGHPYNWNQLSQQCLMLINSFHSEICEITKRFKPIESINEFPVYNKSTATDIAKEILLRQRKESSKIAENMINSSRQCDRSPSSITRTSDYITLIKKKFTTAKNYVQQMYTKFTDVFYLTCCKIPLLLYYFGERKETKLIYILAQSKHLIWITQALAAICEKSLHEDRYGVIQTELPNIIKSLLNLKIALDRLNTLNYLDKNDQNFLALKNAVKRSIYRICTVFADYMQDIIDNPDDFRLIVCFTNYQEVW